MKRLLPISLLLAALCISAAAFAQKDKVVEASSKRKPAWIGSSDRSHFAVTEVGETLAAASGKCMASIRQYIVNAVAVNVSSAEKMATRQITRDQLVSAMSDYSSVLMTEAGQLPYLNDITLSNAEAVYWERIYSKKTKTYRYEYSVLYPFPEAARRQLIEALISEIQIYPERQPNGQWLKSIKFKLPIIEEDMSISLDNEEQVECVALMTRTEQ